jgi:hypothetical protein
MREYYTAIGEDPFNVLPQTFLIKSPNDSEFKTFEREYQAIVQRIKDVTKH